MNGSQAQFKAKAHSAEQAAAPVAAQSAAPSPGQPSAKSPHRPPLSASPFVRALAAAGLAPEGAPPSAGAFAERLAGWFAWTDAIALSAALGPAAAHAGGHVSVDALARDLGRLRTAMSQAIAEEPGAAARATDPRRLLPGRATAPVDFLTLRERHAALQRSMETRIAALRARLRDALAGRSPAGARLAAIDAVMEQVVGAQEHTQLAALGGRLEPRFDALCAAAAARVPEAGDAETGAEAAAAGAAETATATASTNATAASTILDPPSPPPDGAARFRDEMRALLLVELDHRLLPLEGLLEALREIPPDRP